MPQGCFCRAPPASDTLFRRLTLALRRAVPWVGKSPKLTLVLLSTATKAENRKQKTESRKQKTEKLSRFACGDISLSFIYFAVHHALTTKTICMGWIGTEEDKATDYTLHTVVVVR